MIPWARLPFFFALSLLLPAALDAQEPDARPMAVRLAEADTAFAAAIPAGESWLALLDAGDYEATWQQTEGPYFVDEILNRPGIRSDPATGVVRPGVPLELTFHVTRVAEAACVPLAGVVVHIHFKIRSEPEADPGLRVHLPALFRRRPDPPDPRDGAVLGKGAADLEERR